MADEEQVAVARQGTEAWNAWRKANPSVRVDLTQAELTGVSLSNAQLSSAGLNGANLARADLSGAHLSWADLEETTLTGANLTGADLSRADLLRAYLAGATLSGANLYNTDLTKANLTKADLRSASLIGTSCLLKADLSGADLSGAHVSGANFYEANLSGATLTNADFTGTQLVRTNFTGADLTGCRVYGISAWNLKLDEATKQKDLIITPYSEPDITVDNLEVAQFIYLLLNNERIRHVIDTITSKVVLILGSFSDERKVVLEAIREVLRQHDYTPVLFDFDKPRSRSTDETVSTLAHMARFVIADLPDAKSVLQELRAIVPTNPSVPVQPLILATQKEPGMFDFFRNYRCMLEPYRYASPEQLIADLNDVIVPAETKALELRGVSPPTA
jgi:uncharacterized protein YjbI with pentapeptide repeats